MLHDDIIPRRRRGVRGLLRELLRQRESCMQYWSEDLEAVWGRLSNGLRAPRYRDSLVRGEIVPGPRPPTSRPPPAAARARARPRTRRREHGGGGAAAAAVAAAAAAAATSSPS